MIRRDPMSAAARDHDLIVVGGGVYGVAATLEAARRGLRVLLLERDDFGGATSLNSLATIHGGLRYLQKLDLRRVRESTAERRWFFRNFPDQVVPLACLMPLYGDGWRRPFFFRAASWANDFLSRSRNEGVRDDRRLRAGTVISAEETRRLFPGVRAEGLLGGGVWHDGTMSCPPRLLIEMLRWACHAGALALNYTEAQGLAAPKGHVAGVEAKDRTDGETRFFRAAAVLNCAGPWGRSVATAFDHDVPRLFRPSLAFNVLLDRKPPSAYALAVAAPEPGVRAYFVIPRGARTLAGTYHASRREIDAGASPSDVRRFLGRLNGAIPGFDADERHVLRIYAGSLPVNREGTVDLATREVIYNHAESGGPERLLSVSGVKYTTARLVAEKALRRLFARHGGLPPIRTGAVRPEPFASFDPALMEGMLTSPSEAAAPVLRRIIEEESVVCREDLVYRRADWGLSADEAAAADRRIADLAPGLPPRITAPRPVSPANR